MNKSYIERVLASTPAPDFGNLQQVLAKGIPSRSTLFEFFLNGPLYQRLAGCDAFEEDVALFRLVSTGFRQAGYDYVTFKPNQFCFPAGVHEHDQTISLNDGIVISDRESFEKYQWIDPDDCTDYEVLDQVAKWLPEGMKIVLHCPGGVLENVIRLCGYDNLCFMLMDDPELAKELFDAIGSRLVRHVELGAVYDSVGACISNDDWGFKTQPMLSPADLRTYVFPWHQKIVAAAHAAGKPCILHSCGNASEIMEDIIEGMEFDGKHSFEDTIEPIETTYETYKGRVALLGGMDVDFVIRSEPDAVYRRSREMLEQAAGVGGYALGTGNSVPAYVPDENYSAMIWAALETR
jgi:uroporphyrinogen decarboxylase